MEVEIWYAALDEEGKIAQYENALVDNEGPNLPHPFGDFEYVQLLGEPLSTPAPTPTSVPRVVEQQAVWVEEGNLPVAKALAKARISAAYLLANKTSFTFQGKEIQADEHAMTQINRTDAGIQRRGALRSDWPGAWKALDNSYIPIPDVATWGAMMDALETQGLVNFLKAQALKNSIDAAETIEEIQAISWT